MRKLIINLRGGTGNQLFQAAAAASLANIYEKDCYFYKDDIHKDKYKRNLEITDILMNLKIQENQFKLTKKIIFLNEYDIDHPLYFSKKSPLASLNNDIFLAGNFTNYRILKPEVVQKIKSTIREIDTVYKLKGIQYFAIHIRELHGSGSNKIRKKIDNLDIAYYARSIKKICTNPKLSKIKNAIVFSDMFKNPESSILLPQIKNLLSSKGINYINGDNYISSTLDILNIFSFAKSSIISNSSLSWWGAYLSDGLVYCPVMNLWEPDIKVPDKWEQIYGDEICPNTHHRSNKTIFDTSIKINETIDLRIYTRNRLTFIKIFYILICKIYDLLKINYIVKFLHYFGFVSYNPHKTYH